jgi:FkbM family methyltransferase
MKSRRLYARFVHRGDLVFDIGANIGEQTSAFLHYGARVICVEPDERNLSRLHEAFGFHPDVRIVAAGVGEAVGRGVFFSSPDSSRSTFDPQSMRTVDGCVFHREAEVPIVTLDALIAGHGMPTFIKIDVEGYEPKVLRGLSHPVAALSFEFHGTLFDHLEACVSHLRGLGLDWFNVVLYPIHGSKPFHAVGEMYYPQHVEARTLLADLERLRGQHTLAGDIYASHFVQ